MNLSIVDKKLKSDKNPLLNVRVSIIADRFVVGKRGGVLEKNTCVRTLKIPEFVTPLQCTYVIHGRHCLDRTRKIIFNFPSARAV